MAAARRDTPSSASASESVSAGASRTTESPMEFTSRPRWRACTTTSPASTPFNTTPMSMPRPRASATRPPARSAASRSKRRADTRRAFSSAPPRMAERVASATAAASGLPPKVEAWLPGVRCTPTSSEASRAPMGKPPARALAADMRSGAVPSHSWHQSRPVRPMPVWTSSRQKSAPAPRTRSRAARR